MSEEMHTADPTQASYCPQLRYRRGERGVGRCLSLKGVSLVRGRVRGLSGQASHLLTRVVRMHTIASPPVGRGSRRMGDRMLGRLKIAHVLPPTSEAPCKDKTSCLLQWLSRGQYLACVGPAALCSMGHIRNYDREVLIVGEEFKNREKGMKDENGDHNPPPMARAPRGHLLLHLLIRKHAIVKTQIEESS